MSFQIIPAKEEHIEIIFDFIYQLAEYEKLTDEVVLSKKQLSFHLFENKSAYCLLGFEHEIPIGFALYFYNFSTFKGLQGLYLEDIFVQNKHRGKGYGKAFMLELIKIAKQNNCSRMEWSVLKWNQPAIEFYESLGAFPMNEWVVYRLNESNLK